MKNKRNVYTTECTARYGKVRTNQSINPIVSDSYSESIYGACLRNVPQRTATIVVMLRYVSSQSQVLVLYLLYGTDIGDTNVLCVTVGGTKMP